MIAAAADLLAEGHAALRTGDSAAARDAFERSFAAEPTGDAVEGVARAAYIDLDFGAAIDAWERAYAAHRGGGDQVGAIRVARTLACMHGTVRGDLAVGSGWMARAQTLLNGVGDSPEVGWVALDLGMFHPDRVRKDEHFRDALTVARRLGDVDLELVALAYLGASLVHADRTEEGMLLLDESLAGVAGGEVDDFLILEEIFCQLFSACEHAQDVARADQWMRVGDAIAARRNLPAVSAFCRSHYGGVLTAAGRWPEAETTLMEAVRLWDLGQRSMMRAGALARLADLRVRQGRFEEAGQLLKGVDIDVEPGAARPLAAVHLACGEAVLALDVLERALARIEPGSTASAPLLGLLVDALLVVDEHERASAAAEQLESCAARHTSDYLVAMAALARGRVCLAVGGGDPQACLRDALAGFARAQLPMELARSRLELAGLLVDQRPEVAIAEARAALEAFERLQAAREVDAAAAMLRLLGVRARTTHRAEGLLTKREAEVLELLGHGLSNPEIADRLYISRKTVEHHVGNILRKLGLRSRAEAAGHASREKPAAM